MDTLEFLQDNIGQGLTTGGPFPATDLDAHARGGDELYNIVFEEPEIVLSDDYEELRQLSEESRRNTFQTQYKLELTRQVEILGLPGTESPRRGATGDDDDLVSIVWEEGEG
jgi:hypothetical protein